MKNQLYNVVIADDEKRSIEILKHFLKAYKNYKIVEEAINATDASIAIREFQPDLVFMDNKMPGKTGSELIKELKQSEIENLPLFILYTAYREDVLETYGIEEAIGFLTKPLQPEKLDSELMNFEKQIKRKNAGKSLFLPILSDKLNSQNNSKNKSLKTFSPDDIVYIQAQGSYCDIFIAETNIKKETVCFNLKKIEEELPKEFFFRVHGSHIVNLKYFERIDPKSKMCILKNSESKEEIALKISERTYTKFKDYIANRN